MEKISILVADAELGMREIIPLMLKDKGYDIHVAEDGIKVLEYLGQTSYEVVIIDLYMAYLGGIELLKQIVEKHPQTKVIVMSAHTYLAEAVEARKYGAFDFIEKPFAPNILLQSIQHVIEYSGTQAKQKVE